MQKNNEEEYLIATLNETIKELEGNLYTKSELSSIKGEIGANNRKLTEA